MASPAHSVTSVMLPLLQDEVASHAMVRHTMDIIDKIHNSLYLNQPLIITADKPVYALSKQFPWLYPDVYGEKKINDDDGASSH